MTINVQVAAPVAVLVSIVVAAVVVARDWRHVQFRSAGWLLLSTLFGLPVGLFVLRTAPEHLVRTLLGTMVAGFSVWSLMRVHAYEGYFLLASVLGLIGYWMAGLWTPAVNHYSRLDGGRFLSYVHAFLILVGVMLIVQSAHAQQAEPDRSEERIKRALQNPQPIVFNTTLPPLVDTPDVKRFGIFTLEPPQANGQIIQIGVPIGALIMQAVNGIATAHHRRVERKAHEEVMRALADFEAQRPQHSE